MKKLLALVLILFFFVPLLYAGVTAKIIDIQVQDRDYIWVAVEYDIDGEKVVNKYPVDFKNFVGRTPQEFVQWLKVNIEYQCDRYIEAKFRKLINQKNIQDKMQALIGKTYSKDSAVVQFDTNNDGNPDYQWEIQTNGTYTETTL